LGWFTVGPAYPGAELALNTYQNMATYESCTAGDFLKLETRLWLATTVYYKFAFVGQAN